MTISELIAALEEELERVGDGELEVRIALQPSYPLEAAVAGVVNPNDIGDEDEDYDEEVDNAIGKEEIPACVYILQGNHIGYASKRLWDR